MLPGNWSPRAERGEEAFVMAYVTDSLGAGYGIGSRLDISAVFMPVRIVGQDGAGSAWPPAPGGCFWQ